MQGKKYLIKWKLRAIAGPQGKLDQDLAAELEITKQSFAYRMRTGFSISEVDRLAAVLRVDRKELSNEIC